MEMWSNSLQFISFEGPDGSGKSTISKMVLNKLENYYKNNKKFLLTREPGGTKVSEMIRNILLTEDIDVKTEALLFAASRNEHVKKTIIPFIEQGGIVLCDRFLHSSLAYQGYFRDIGIQKVLEINQFAIGDFQPDIIFYLDVKPEVSIERLTKYRENLDKMDFTMKEQIYKINEGYKKVLDLKNVYKIDANREIETIVDEIFNIIIKRIK